MKIVQTITKSTLVAAVLAIAAAPTLFALTSSPVTPVAPGEWTQEVADAGGVVEFVTDGAPAGLGDGSLKLSTSAEVESRASLGRLASLPLSELTAASYWTKQITSVPADGNATFQLDLMLSDAADSKVTFTYQPSTQLMFNQSATPVQNGVWQQWDVRSGFFQASKSYVGGFGEVIGGAGSVSYYTVDNILAFFPTAQVVGHAVNLGPNAAGFETRVDGVTINDTVYDFEYSSSYTIFSKDECKKYGWKTLKTREGLSFKNQGDCVSYAVHQEKLLKI
jgi:hypothetical protein